MVMHPSQTSSAKRPARSSTTRPLKQLFRHTCLFVQLAILGSAANAQLAAAPPSSPSVLVELFTSEGCSSCPPADRLLAELDKKQPIPGTKVIVLSEHVDYWNSLGWQDPFSSHQWSERQDEYAQRFGLDSVYTPQMIVDGRHQVSGGDSRAVVAAIAESSLDPHVPIAIADLSPSGGQLKIAFTAGAADHATLYAVLADDAGQSSVPRGENAGRVLQHVAIARSLVRVADLKTRPLAQTTTIALPPGSAGRRLRVILFARDGRDGRIVGAAAREL
jgi:hypothetical protein